MVVFDVGEAGGVMLVGGAGWTGAVLAFVARAFIGPVAGVLADGLRTGLPIGLRTGFDTGLEVFFVGTLGAGLATVFGTGFGTVF